MLFVGGPVFSHLGRSWGPIWSWGISPASVRAQRGEAGAKAAGSASSPHYATDSTRPKVTVVAVGSRPGLCHAMGSMLCRFLGFLRAGEFTLTVGQDFDPSSALTVQDVSVDQHSNPSMVRLHQKQSKTDPFRHGVDVVLGRTNMVLHVCPVAALLACVRLWLGHCSFTKMAPHSLGGCRTPCIGAVRARCIAVFRSQF